jgi:hypothetical protein
MNNNENLEVKPVSQEVADLAAKALADVHDRSFSGRHPELGKMIKCQVCNRRHRDSIKCQQIFKELWIDEDLETGKFETVYATVPLHNQTPTIKSVIGAAQFKGKRRIRRPNPKDLPLVELTRKIYGRENYDENKPEDKQFMIECRVEAVRQLKQDRKAKAKRYRRQQDISRRINRGLLRAGYQL